MLAYESRDISTAIYLSVFESNSSRCDTVISTGVRKSVGTLSGPEMTLSLLTKGLDFGRVTFVAAT